MGLFKKLFGGFNKACDADLPIGDLKAGALYSIYNGDENNNFGVVKILVLEPPVVHICVFNNSFATRPETIDPEKLSLGVAEDVLKAALEDDGKMDEIFANGGFGIGHMPIHLRDFIYGWQPKYLMDSPVVEAELEGYEIWKKEGGGVFGVQ